MKNNVFVALAKGGQTTAPWLVAVLLGLVLFGWGAWLFIKIIYKKEPKSGLLKLS